MGSSICTFNIRNHIKGYKGNRSKDICNLINGYDVICLQELTPITNIALRWLLRKEYNFYGCWFGTGVFVKKQFKIVEKHKIKLFKSFWQVIKNFNLYRKAVYVKVTLEENSSCDTNIYSCHFGFGDEWNENYELLQDYISKHPGLDMVVCGDFNITPTDSRYDKILQLATLNSCVTSHGTAISKYGLANTNIENKPTVHDFKPKEYWKTIDYILTDVYRVQHGKFNTKYTDASDHLMCVWKGN